MAIFHGTKHDDDLNGTSGDDTFDLYKGGEDTAHGGAGDDVFNMGASLDAGDRLDGGADRDTVLLHGDYSAGLVLQDQTLQNIEVVRLGAGFDYNLTLADGNVAAGQALTINASKLGAANHLTFDGSAELDGRFVVDGGAGDDVLTGGAKADKFQLDAGGNDTVHGGGGNDTIVMGATFTAADQLDGGAGNDTVILKGEGDDFVQFNATTMTGVETLVLQGGTGVLYELATHDATVASGATLTIDASALTTANFFSFDGSAELDGHFAFIGGTGDNNLTGGAQADSFELTQSRNDTVHGGGGNDTITMGATLTAADTIDGGTGNDTLELNGDYSAGLIFGASTIAGIETLKLDDGHSYKLTMNDGNVASGATLNVDAGALTGANRLIFDGSAENGGFFVVTGGAGDDTITGNNTGSIYHLEAGGNDTVTGGSGNDTIYMGASLTAADAINGGAGNDIVVLDGDYSAGLTFGATTMTKVETLQLTAGHDYDLTLNALTPSGRFVVDGSGLGAGDSLTVDASASTGPFVTIKGGAGDDILTGTTKRGAIFDISHGGDDIVHALGDEDTVNAGGALTVADTIYGDGSTVLILSGDYSAGLTLGGEISNIADIRMSGSNDYNITTTDALVPHGQTFTFDSISFAFTNSFTFDGSAETDGNFFFQLEFKNVDITGGAGNDTISAASRNLDSTYTVHGGAGDDAIEISYVGPNDFIDGGAGNDALALRAVGSSLGTVSSTQVTGVNALWLGGGSPSGTALTVIGDITGGEGALSIDAGGSLGTYAILLDITAATSSSYSITGGDQASNDFNVGTNITRIDSLSGNIRNDTLEFGGAMAANTTVTLDDVHFQSVETIQIDASTNLVAVDFSGNIASGFGLTVNASAMTAGLTLDFSAATSSGYAVTGGAGNDTVKFGGNFSAADTVNGGGGSDTLELNGDYSAGLTLGATTLTNIETIKVDDGHSYDLVSNDGNVASGATLTVDASALTGTHALTFDGSAENGGFYTVKGGAGADKVTFGSNFSVSDSIDGGAGNDTLTLNNIHGTLHFADTTMTNVETLAIASNLETSFTITTTDANVAAGATLTVDFSLINLSDIVTFDGSAEQDGHFAFIVPHFASTIVTFTGGALSDSFALPGGDGATENLFNGGGGDDTLNTTAAASSVNFNGGTGNDTVALTGGGTESYISLTLTSVENMTLDDNSWTIAMGTGHGTSGIAPGDTLNVNATVLSGGHTLAFDGSGVVDGGAFVFTFAGNFSASDSLTGGAGSDTLSLNGDYGSAIIFGANTIRSVETIKVDDGHSYDLVSNDGNVAPGATLTVDASALTGSNQLFFSGSNETDGHFAFIGGAGADSLEGGSQSDTFDLSRSDGAFAFGDGGNDTFTVVSAAKFLDDFMDGGAGSDTLVLNGDFSTQTAITGSDVENIETLQLLGGANNYNLIFTDGVTTAITVDASAVSSLVFSGAGDTTTAFTVTGSAGNDTIAGGNKADAITGGLGADTLTGGGGADTFNYAAAGDSNTAAGYDTITDLTTSDFIHVAGGAPNFFAAETVNTYQGSLDADLASALSGMTSGTYAVVTLSGAGDPLAGHTFLVVDGNGTAGYTAGADYVIDITGYGGDPSQIHFT